MNSFILASASPRRKLLLEREGYRFEVIPSHIDESQYEDKSLSSTELTKVLARAKAMEVAAEQPGRFVLGCDTVVDYQGMIIGKPEDAADAERITRMLFSGPHDVITGISLLKPDEGIEITEAITTRVYPAKLTEQQIMGHIEGGGWKGQDGLSAGS